MKFQTLILTFFLLMSDQALAGTTATRSDDGNQALKRMQYMLKQLTNEKAELEIENGKLTGDIESLEKKLKKAKNEIEENELSIQRMEANINGLNGTIEKREAKIAKREKQIREVIGKYQDAQLLIRQLNNEKAELELTIVERDNTILEHDEKNLKMYEANLELMDLYENKSSLDSILQGEGVTGLKQVEIENILQEYRFKLEDNRVSQQESN